MAQFVTYNAQNLIYFTLLFPIHCQVTSD